MPENEKHWSRYGFRRNRPAEEKKLGLVLSDDVRGVQAVQYDPLYLAMRFSGTELKLVVKEKRS